MTKQRKLFLWVALVLSVPAGGYAFLSFIFYSWLSAAEPERWPPERAGLWAGGAAIFALLFFILFVYCLVSLIKAANRAYREEQHVDNKSSAQHCIQPGATPVAQRRLI
jgi:hypothetical protein